MLPSFMFNLMKNCGRTVNNIVPGVTHALVPEMPEQLLVLRTQWVQRVSGHDGFKLFLQVVRHLPLTSLPSLSLLAPTSGIPADVPALGKNHRVAVLVQENGDGHGRGFVWVGGRGELVCVDAAAAALLALLWHLPHVEDELALAQQRAVVYQQQVDVVQKTALCLS